MDHQHRFEGHFVSCGPESWSWSQIPIHRQIFDGVVFNNINELDVFRPVFPSFPPNWQGLAGKPEFYLENVFLLGLSHREVWVTTEILLTFPTQYFENTDNSAWLFLLIKHFLFLFQLYQAAHLFRFVKWDVYYEPRALTRPGEGRVNSGCVCKPYCHYPGPIMTGFRDQTR